MAELTQQQKQLMSGFEAAKQQRMRRESYWREVSDFCEVSEAVFDVNGAVLMHGGPSTVRKVYTGIGILNAKRCAALLTAYLVNPVRPFMTASVEMPADVSGGWVVQNGEDAATKEYLDGLSWQMFYEQMRSKSGFMTSTALALRDFTNYGAGIKFSKLNIDGEARFQHIPRQNCWFAVNDEGEVDTLYYRAFYRLDRLLLIFPAAAANEKIAKLKEQLDKGKGAPSTLIEVVHVVQPREGGVRGAEAQKKPFASVFFLPGYDAHVLQEDGFDSFPYSVARNDATADNPDGVGISEGALPDLKVLNHYQAGLEDNLDLINEPPLLHFEGLFDKFSFDAASTTSVDPYGIGRTSIKDSLMQLPVAGAVSPVMGYIDRGELRIGEFYYTDWMKLRESGTMTATEVNERRDLRIRAMSSLVPGIDRQFAGEGDRIMEMKIRRKLLPAPPPSLANRHIDWEYAGPLANAMKANQVDVLGRLIGMRTQLIAEDPAVADTLPLDGLLRAWCDGQGVEPGIVASKEDAAAAAQKRAQDQAMQQQNEQLTARATAARDAGQGFASVANAANGGNGQAIQVAQQMAA